MPQRERKSLVAPAVNSCPPSLDISSGTPKVEKKAQRLAISPANPDRGEPVGDKKISTPPLRRSPITR
jgi:hypothetical protein